MKSPKVIAYTEKYGQWRNLALQKDITASKKETGISSYLTVFSLIRPVDISESLMRNKWNGCNRNLRQLIAPGIFVSFPTFQSFRFVPGYSSTKPKPMET